jgi:hypothetical protein
MAMPVDLKITQANGKVETLHLPVNIGSAVACGHLNIHQPQK